MPYEEESAYAAQAKLKGQSPAYKKSSGFKMIGSPHKTGVIEGTSGHASALKHASGIAGVMDTIRQRQDEQNEARQNEARARQGKRVQIATNKARSQENLAEVPPTPNAPVAPVAPVAQAAPVVDPTVDPNAPMGSEGMVQPDPEELETN